jgi:hypothetical protein
MVDEALDRIEMFTEDAFGWLETKVRRLGKWLASRPEARRPRSVATGDHGRVERTRRPDSRQIPVPQRGAGNSGPHEHH